jgi:hypothetical protein
LASSLERDQAMVMLYAPYCGGVSREGWLKQALELLSVGSVAGQRPLHPEGSHRFELLWQAGEAPQEPSSCELKFPATPEVHYTFTLPTHQLVSWLMDLLEARALTGGVELPETFWRWLILGEPAASIGEPAA